MIVQSSSRAILTKLQSGGYLVNNITEIPACRGVSVILVYSDVCAGEKMQLQTPGTDNSGMPLENRPKIGIVDDEEAMRTALVALLRDNGFDPVPMAGSADFTALGPAPGLALVLIDLKLRGESGLALAQHIRATCDLPIVMLTGTGDETDRIVGLEVGADDYLLKPFNPRELIARIRAVLRRSEGSGAAVVPESGNAGPESLIRFGQMSVDPEQRSLHGPDGEEIALTNAEFRLLDYFLQRPDQIIPRADLLAGTGSDFNRYLDRTIDVLILRLRRKIERNPSKPEHLQTRRGQGYIFVISPPGEPG